MGYEAWRQKALGFDDALPATELSGTGENIRTAFIAVADQGNVHAQIFERIVAGIAHQFFNGVGPIGLRPAAHGGFVHFKEYPVIAGGANAGIGRKGKGCSIAAGAFVGHHGGQRLDDEINYALDLAEAGFSSNRGNGVED